MTTSYGLTNKTTIYTSWGLMDDFALVKGGVVLAENLGGDIVHVGEGGNVMQRASFTTPTSVTFLAPPAVSYGDLLLTEMWRGKVKRLINDGGLETRN